MSVLKYKTAFNISKIPHGLLRCKIDTLSACCGGIASTTPGRLYPLLTK